MAIRKKYGKKYGKKDRVLINAEGLNLNNDCHDFQKKMSLNEMIFIDNINNLKQVAK